MNFKKLFLMLTFFVLLGTTAFAQFSPVYVDVTNGGIGAPYDGTTPAKAFARIGDGLAALSNDGTLVIYAGSYNGLLNNGANIVISTGVYAALTSGLTIELRPLPNPPSLIVDLIGGNIEFNITGGTLNIVSTGGAYLRQASNTITLTAGNINLDAAASWTLANAGTTTINLVGGAAFTTAAPTKNVDVSLSYTGTGDVNPAGQESNYGSYGAGTITVNKVSGTVTFPNAITAVAGITVQTGASAVFSGNVAMGAFDITNSSTGSVTFDGTVGLKYKNAVGAETDIGQVANTAGGSISFNQPVTWSSSATDITAARDFDAAGFYSIDNQAAGAILFNSTITLTPDPGTTGTEDVTMRALNNSGTLSLGSMTALVSSAAGGSAVVKLNVVNSTAGGALNLAGGTLRGTLTNGNATALTTVNGALQLRGVLTNSGIVTLNADVTMPVALVNLTNTGTINGTGKTICSNTAGTTSFNGGALGNIQVNGTGGTVNFITNAFTANTMTLTAGTVGLNIAGTTTSMVVEGAAVTVATTVVQTVTNFTETSGSFTLTAGTTTTLDVKGDFNRTGGTFTAQTISLVSFTGTGVGAQAVNPGALFQTDKLSFNNVGGIITVGNSIRATGNVIIYSSTQVALGTINIILIGATNSITNNGTYTSSGIGGIIVGGITTVVGGVAGNGYAIIGTGAYSNIIVDIGTSVIAVDAMDAGVSNASPTTITANAHAYTNGDVIYVAGNTDIPNGYYAVTYVNANTFTIPYDNTGGSAAANGTLTHVNTVKVTAPSTNVKWNGVLTLKTGAVGITTTDFGPVGSTASIVRYPDTSPGIFAITGAAFNTNNVSYDLTYTGALAADRPVGGELTATPANVKTWTIQTTGAFLNTLPVNLPNITFGGTLYIENGATLDLPAGTATAFILSGTAKTHTIRGTISFTGGDLLSVTGTGVTINGSLTAAHAATIGNVKFNGTGQTVSNIFLFSGTVETGASSTVTFGMGSAAARQVITGLLTLGGSTFTLTTNINPQAGITHSAGVFDFGANTVNLTTGGNFLQTAGSYLSSGGYLQFGVAGNLTLTSAMPYLRANNFAITLASAVTISQNLDIAGATPAGKIANGGFNLTIQNTMTTNAGPAGGIFTGTGALVLSGAAPTITASAALIAPTISNLTINSTGTATLASTSTTAKIYTISGVLTHTAGNLATTINSITLTGTTVGIPGAAYTRTTATGQITQSTGILTFAAAAAQSAAQGTGFTIPNLTINNTAGTGADVTFAGGATNDFTVTGTLRLTAGSFSSTVAGKLHLGNLATIERYSTVSTLVQIPTFDGDVNLSYRGATTGVGANEMPTAASNKLNNMVVNLAAVGNTFALAANASLKGTLTLTQGTFNAGAGPYTITLASGSTISMGAGVMGFLPTVTTYNLTYTGPYAYAPAAVINEFRNGTGIIVNNLTINGTTAALTLPVAKTVVNFILTLGTFSDGGFVFTVTGNFSAAGGTYTTVAGGSLVLAGTTLQTITAAAAGTNLVTELVLNNALGFQLAGGNLNLTGTVGGPYGHITFTNGIFRTGNFILYLASPTTGFVSGDPVNRTQGFLGASSTSHVLGNVGKVLNNTGLINGSSEASNVFPVGTGTIYRPATLTFNPAFGVPTTPNAAIVVSHVNTSPGGSSGLPIPNGVMQGVDISRYPSYYWSIYTVGNVGQSTVFDLALRANNFTDYDAPANVRIIRRFGTVGDINNNWLLQGVNTGYDNQVNSLTGFTAINRSSQGGLAEIPGAVFTLGVKSNMSVIHPIAKQWLVLSGGAKDYVLTNVFSGNLGTLSFLAQSSNPTVATAISIPLSPWAPATLRIAPVATGDANVTITAQDNLGGVIVDSYTFTFAVNVGLTDVAEEAIPTEFALFQNFPNPFNPTTNIKFALPKEANVSLKIYNVLGQEVASLVNQVMPAGYHTVDFNATQLSSGMYIYRIEAGDFVQVKKMLLMK